MPPPCHAGRFVNVIVKGMPMCASEYRSRLHLACKPSCCSNCGRPRRGLRRKPALHHIRKVSLSFYKPQFSKPIALFCPQKCTNAPGSCGSGALVYHLGRGSISQKRTHLFDNPDGLNRNQSTTCWISTNSLCSRGYLIAACAAASRARGTRKGLQDT